MGEIIDISKFGSVIAKFIDESKEDIHETIEDGLDESEEIMIAALKSSSPRDSGKYAENWKSKYPRGTYKRHRYIHNPTRVMYKGKEVPLAAFLEYSRKGFPHIAKTIQRNRARVISAIEQKIKGTGG